MGVLESIIRAIREQLKWRENAMARGMRVGCLERGRPNRRIIRCFVRDGVEYSLHATKGWRTRRLAFG